MKILIYILIFIFKVFENTISTLRIIVVSNGKKILGAILQGIVSIIWVISTSLVIINIQKDPIKIIAFTLGSLIGSYIGSIIEEKLALGTNMIIAAIEKNKTNKIITTLKKQKTEIIILNGKRKDELKNILLIITKRKNMNNITKLIKKIDTNATIIIEKAMTN
jgi:uncharacterized protein YebE (UPF0316 family)